MNNYHSPLRNHFILFFIIWIMASGFIFFHENKSMQIDGFTNLLISAKIPINHLQDRPEIRFNQIQEKPNYGTVEIVGIDLKNVLLLKQKNLSTIQWKELFPIYTGSKIPDDPALKPPVLGTYQIENKTIRFKPRFPFVKGLSYSAKFDLPLFYSLIGQIPLTPQSKLETVFVLPKPPQIATTTVTHIYPTTSEIPENLLKLYIHFSAPMSRGDAYKNIHLFDESGNEISQAFLEIDQELWDPATQRLTLFFDPGRIKRGLRPHKELGLALQKNNTYRLVINQNWKDADRNPLVEEFQKSFKVIAADRTPLNHKKWKLTPPAAGTTDPVVLLFPEPLDHALLGRLLDVTDNSNHPVEGSIKIAKAETRWEFKPDHPWNADTYIIHINTVLEDLAGNTLKSAFDVDMQNREHQYNDRETVTLQFTTHAKKAQ